MITLLFEPKNGAVVNKLCMAVSEKDATKFSSSKLRFALVCHRIFAAGRLLLFALHTYAWPCTQHAAAECSTLRLPLHAARSWQSASHYAWPCRRTQLVLWDTRGVSRNFCRQLSDNHTVRCVTMCYIVNAASCTLRHACDLAMLMLGETSCYHALYCVLSG